MSEKQIDAIDTKYGVNWKYLDTLLDSYNEMIHQYGIYVHLLDKNKHTEEVKRNACTAIIVYYSSVQYAFDSWLNGIKEGPFEKLKPEDYYELTSKEDPVKIKLMFRAITNWSQSIGPFATMVQLKDLEAPDLDYT